MGWILKFGLVILFLVLEVIYFGIVDLLFIIIGSIAVGSLILLGDYLIKKSKKPRAFVICSVRGASQEYRRKLEKFAEEKEKQGYEVHLPHRDTDQNASGLDICKQNRRAINKSNVIFIFYNSKSQGTHFDIGMSFAYNKKIVIVENEPFDEHKSFPRMLWEWENQQEII